MDDIPAAAGHMLTLCILHTTSYSKLYGIQLGDTLSLCFLNPISLLSLGAPLLELEASRAFGFNGRLRRCPKENTFHTLHRGHVVVLYPQ